MMVGAERLQEPEGLREEQPLHAPPSLTLPELSSCGAHTSPDTRRNHGSRLRLRLSPGTALCVWHAAGAARVFQNISAVPEKQNEGGTEEG